MNGLGFNNVKLTDKDVYEILFLNKVKGLQPYEIERRFPVSRTTIKNIVNGKSRKDCYFAFKEYKEKTLNKL
ncbi:hypothetical protein [Anaerobacillus sp. 1_MG-2023]|uniref:hypothetical protein n=1 Tax=Anaerobacillus sp. 1_MG-2023 TaxID=3062655 RepID=UPI0026E3C147|nr:hypothetical protein [Anaerobacillus sp. 1_MG-2023]MDO6658676.1 hypothetical protein [Anaerobacillus sp. 1_MG-2023]